MSSYDLFMIAASVFLFLFVFCGLFGFSPKKLLHRFRGDDSHPEINNPTRRYDSSDSFSGDGGGDGGSD